MRTARKIFLHVGHGKTGSSYLQTCFACSIENLEAAGFSYPIDEKSLLAAKGGLTTEGNYPPASLATGHSLEDLTMLISSLPPSKRENILISNEGIFQSVLLHDFFGRLHHTLPEYEIRVLLFIRDPFDHLISAYQELLKEDLVDEIDDLFRTTSVPSNVAEFLDLAEASGIDVTVFNFDRNREWLKNRVENWLGLPEGQLNTGPRPSVNRSMDRSEIAVQKIFNKLVGSKARQFVADALARELPDVRPTKPRISPVVLRAFIDRMNHDINLVNERIPPTEHYTVPSFEQATAALPPYETEEKIELSLAQFEVIAKHISQHLPPNWKK